MKILKLFFILNFMFLYFNFSHGQAGTLDSTFDYDGLDTTYFPGMNNGINAIAIQPDGKIVAAGYLWLTGTHSNIAMARYNTDGSLDTAFNGTGTLIDSVFSKAYATCVTLQPDGKILVGGGTSIANTGYSLVARYNTDGTRDTTFGSGGVATVTYGYPNTPTINAITLFPNGQIVLAGYNGINGGLAHTMDFALLRFSSSGVLDTTFGNNGLVVTNLVPPWNDGDIAYSVIALPGNKILAGGMANFYGPANFNPKNVSLIGADFALVQYDSTGALDTTFNFNGKVIKSVNNNSYEYGHTVLLQPDGKILMGGFTADDTSSNYCVLRYNSDGTADSTFGINGIAFSSTPSWWSGGEIARQSDGKIVLTGPVLVSGDVYFQLVRFDSTGIVDSTFGTNGKVFTDFGYQQNDPTEIKIQSDGKIVVAGSTSNAFSIRTFALARYLNDLNVGILDFDNVNNSNILIYPNPVHHTTTLEYTLMQNEALTIQLLDIQGKLVKTFLHNQFRTTGTYKEQLSFETDIAAGHYILTIGNETSLIIAGSRSPVSIKLIKQ